jgi:predicted transcriptional regulator of viral defense system
MLRGHGGVFTLAEAKEMGISQQTVSRLVASHHLLRVGRGLYVHRGARLGANTGFQIACAKFGPESAIGGLSALFHYNLCEQVPGETWVLVPPETRTSVPGFRLIRTRTTLRRGIVAEKGYRIASVERAVLEGLKYATKIGERVAFKAARDALAHGMTNEVKLGKSARELGLQPILHRYMELILP